MLYALVAIVALFIIPIVILALVVRSQSTTTRDAVAARLASGEAQLQATSNQLDAETQRDAAIVKAAAAQAAADRAIAQLAETQRALSAATTKLAEHLKTAVIGMSDEDALAAINAELNPPKES